MKNDNLETYRIYHYEKKRCMIDYAFKSKDRSTAVKIYKNWCKTHNNDKKTYFYKRVMMFKVLQNDGTVTENEFHEHDVFGKKSDLKYKLIEEHAKGYQKGKKKTETELKSDLIDYIKTGHTCTEWCNLYAHILDDLEYNLPILIKKHIGYPSCYNDFAAKKLGDTIDDWKNGYSKKVSNEAFDMWTADLNKLLQHVQLYKYFENFGIIDPNNKNEVQIDKKWRKILPVYEGTEKDLDHKKLMKMKQAEWNAIWDFMKKYGQMLWD